MRIDQFLFINGYAESRTEAKNLVLSGAVTVKNKPVTKPSFDIAMDETEVFVKKAESLFASRGGYKLLGALRDFKIDVSGKFAIDIGASSGGFTDCLLQNGAAHVIAVDSGKMQIKDFLRRDGRVTVIENYNARYMKGEDFEYTPNLAVMDVSFISQTLILPAVSALLRDGGLYIGLIKPQFEAGRAALSKGGIVKNVKDRRAAVERVLDAAQTHGLCLCGLIESPIQGGDGNVEYLAYYIKREQSGNVRQSVMQTLFAPKRK